MKLWWIALALTVAACGKAGGAAEKGAAQDDVLSRIETWKAPGDPEETYDKVKKMLALKAAAEKAGQPPPIGSQHAKPLPPTLVDTFAADVRLLAFYDLGVPKLDKTTLTPEIADQVITLYAKLAQKDLRGLRPIAHKTFIESLDVAARTRLAVQLVAHVHKTGFLGEDTIGDDTPPPRSAEATAALGGGAAAPAAAPSTLPTGVILFAGVYKSTEGDALLIQTAANPTKVIGAYSGRAKGKLDCIAEGPVLTCDWAETGSPGGRAQFTRTDDGNMKGAWGMGKRTSGGGKWNWTLLAAGKLE